MKEEGETGRRQGVPVVDSLREDTVTGDRKEIITKRSETRTVRYHRDDSVKEGVGSLRSFEKSSCDHRNI